MPKLPKLPNPEQIPGIFDRITKGIDYASKLVEIVGTGVDKVADALGNEGSPLPTITKHPPKTKASPQAESPHDVSNEGKTKATAEIATACVACALGHFSTSSGLLNEAVRFKDEGMTSNEILDRIAGALEQQNALEREDLSPVKIHGLPEWERPIAEEALTQSRQLRHRLEGIQSVDELEALAADTKRYYIKLNRQWFKGRFGYLGAKKADAIAQRVGGS